MWLRKGYLAFHRRVNAWMLNYGITADQFVVLRVVGREPGITQIEIVKRTASDPNTVAAILRLLEQRFGSASAARPRSTSPLCVSDGRWQQLTAAHVQRFGTVAGGESRLLNGQQEPPEPACATACLRDILRAIG